MTYQERPRKNGGTEASLDNGKTWRRLLPIAFTAANAQKCFDGAKTQTRRLADLPVWFTGHIIWAGSASRPEAVMASKDGSQQNRARYHVGDILWIQEPWQAHVSWNHCKPTSLPEYVPVFYAGEPERVANEQSSKAAAGKLRPGRFLPMRFARPARYEVTAVRCERVNEISEADASAEGAEPCERQAELMKSLTGKKFGAFTVGFGNLWDSIYSKPGTRFEDGPWVWAYTFRRVL
jgi:hypothetical protein